MSRQVGTVVGIALLGALVQTTASNSAASRLTGLPESAVRRLSSTLGHGGAQLVTPGRLPAGWSTERLETIGGEAYVAGIHSVFVVGGFVLLLASLAAGLLIRVNKTRVVPLGEASVEAVPNELVSVPISPALSELAVTVAQA
jgi:hypothetical protein